MKRPIHRRDSVLEPPIPSKRQAIVNEPPSRAPGYHVRSLGEDGTFYLPGDVRLSAHPDDPQPCTLIFSSTLLPNPTDVNHAAVEIPPLLNSELGNLKDEVLEVTCCIVDELRPFTPSDLGSYSQVHFFTTSYRHASKFKDVLQKLTQTTANQAEAYNGKSTRLRKRAERFQNLQSLANNHVVSSCTRYTSLPMGLMYSSRQRKITSIDPLSATSIAGKIPRTTLSRFAHPLLREDLPST